jgi:hypothetical protein
METGSPENVGIAAADKTKTPNEAGEQNIAVVESLPQQASSDMLRSATGLRAMVSPKVYLTRPLTREHARNQTPALWHS